MFVQLNANVLLRVDKISFKSTYMFQMDQKCWWLTRHNFVQLDPLE